MATNKPTNSPAELDKLRAENALMLAHLKYTEEWARYHDHGMRTKTIGILKQLGEWPTT
jgi:hypothetical protein